MTGCGKGIKELVRELVELQDRMDELRHAARNRLDTTDEAHHERLEELVRLAQREHEVIAALRRQRPG